MGNQSDEAGYKGEMSVDLFGKGIETKGTIDIQEIEEKDWYHAVASNPAFDFLRETEEDIYSPNDGRPFSQRND